MVVEIGCSKPTDQSVKQWVQPIQRVPRFKFLQQSKRNFLGPKSTAEQQQILCNCTASEGFGTCLCHGAVQKVPV